MPPFFYREGGASSLLRNLATKPETGKTHETSVTLSRCHTRSPGRYCTSLSALRRNALRNPYVALYCVSCLLLLIHNILKALPSKSKLLTVSPKSVLALSSAQYGMRRDAV